MKMNLREQIEAQRGVLDQLAGNALRLTELVEEGRKLDRLIEAYEDERRKA